MKQMFREIAVMPSKDVEDKSKLHSIVGNRFKERVPLAPFTSARVGGLADVFISVENQEELVESVSLLWDLRIPFRILGSGSNMLVSDEGVREVVILNKARKVNFDEQGQPPTVWAESGANLGLIARQAAAKGLGGLEWAVGIPGTVGGAIVGNAGAHGDDIAGSLLVAEILHQYQKDDGYKQGMHQQIEVWLAHQFEFGYRTSVIKEPKRNAVVLNAVFGLEHTNPEETRQKIQQFVEHRQMTQPPGASMGSMFKNPPGDYAGRLIEAAGLKGVRIGSAEISRRHANFFINLGNASAMDIRQLITLAQNEVLEQFGITLELEIELVGEW
jgi:UDP-N-acetylmuramate dehydrogenase